MAKILLVEDDRVLAEDGLNAGGDDYIVMPFDVRELMVRIRSILRRPPEMLPTQLKIRGVSLDAATRTLVTKSSRIHLTPRESAF